MAETGRLYYTDPYLRRFNALVVDAAGDKVYLDQTAFYPTSGGQPFDTGVLGPARVLEVIDEGDRIAHVIEGPAPSGPVAAEIDWDRRFDHMQQHSGQHLLSAVLHDLFGIPTVSFHLGEDSSTIDVATPSLEATQVDRAQDRAMEIVLEARPISISFEESSTELALRKASEREGVLRIISIADFDRSACGGTHVRSTAEIGPIQIRKLEKIRGNVRIEFLCGWRAVRRSRADYRAATEAARFFSLSIDELPDAVRIQLEKLQESEKARKKMGIEIAQYHGRDLYGATKPDAAGVRRVEQQVTLGDDTRTTGIAFTSQERAIYLAVSENPPSFLLAASKDSGVNAGDIVKRAVSSRGGRGGGSPTLAQGSVPAHEFQAALDEIRQAVAARP